MAKIDAMRFLQTLSKKATGKDFYELDAETKQFIKEPILSAIRNIATKLIKEPDATSAYEEAKADIEKIINGSTTHT